MNCAKAVILLTTILTSGVWANASSLAVERLRCEYKENPLGLDANPPRLSWIVTSAKRGARQTAYQVLVASTAESIANDKGDLWDSGKVASSQTTLISYAGSALASRAQCFWKVRVWDEADHESAWSSPTRWTMGLLDKSDWQGKYIGLAKTDSPMLRKEIQLEGIAANAFMYVNALGYYELYINGEKVDDYRLAPAVSQFDKRSFYLTHDVARYLKPGKNVIGLWLGRGWYSEGIPGVVFSGPAVRAQLEVGGKTIAATDASWQACPSGYSLIGKWHSGKYGGERFDATKNPDGFFTGADLKDLATPVEVEVPDHIIAAQPAEPNRAQREISPVSVTPFGPKDWLVDFGTNLTGQLKADFPKLPEGTVLRLEYADAIEDKELDSFNQIDEVVGGGHFANRFNYHAFRYLRVTGVEQSPDPKSMRAYLVRTDFPVFTSFACSNELLTRIHDMLHYTLECLSLGGYLVDCPHIERLGYGGDGQASTPTAMTMFNMGPLYTGWLAHWRDCQREDGSMPHTAPNPWSAGGGPYWCGFIIAASWEMYQDYADKRVLETGYPAMKHWFDYVDKYSIDGLLRRWPDTDYRSWYLGDWARPGRTEKQAERSVDLVNNCFLVQCSDWMASIATLLNQPGDARTFADRAKALRARIQETFYDPARGTYADDTQLDLAYPILANVTPPELRASICKRLEDNIRIDHQGHLDVGLAGVPLLTRMLMETNRNDLVFDYTNQDTFPGWGYMLKNGATTTWEHWDADRSHIHNCYNGIGAWFYRALAGIQPESEHPGYEHFTLNPSIVGDLKWVKAHQDTIRGPIESAWNIQDGNFHWEITIPANATATISIPASNAEAVRESGKSASETEGLKFVRQENGKAIFEAQSGQYKFDTKLPS